MPLFLELCLLGLAVGTPIAPVGLEWLLVGAIGVAPILWMQWQRPFSIFSLIVLALQPQQLTDDQRRILSLFRTPLEKGLAVLMAIALLATLWQLFQIAPIASEVSPFSRFGHLGGLLVAAIAFLGSNLFLQVPISVLQTLLTSDRAFAATEPYSIAQIAQDFTLLGLRVKKILPPVKPAPVKLAAVKPSPAAPSPVEPSVQTTPVAASTLIAPEIAPPEIAGDDFEDEPIDELTDSELETIEIETLPPSPIEPLLQITVEEKPTEIDAGEIDAGEIDAGEWDELDEDEFDEDEIREDEIREDEIEYDGATLEVIQLIAESTYDPESAIVVEIAQEADDSLEVVMYEETIELQSPEVETEPDETTS